MKNLKLNKKYTFKRRNYQLKLPIELEYKMYLKGEKYYKKFAAMESALAKMNSQSMWLAQQLGMY
jgi:flagellar capping protein FliD